MRKRYLLAGLAILLLMLALVAVACNGEETTTTAAPSTDTTTPASSDTTTPGSSDTTAPVSTDTTTSGPATGEPIKIGLSTSLTGTGAAPAKTFGQGIEAQIEYINSTGGVFGRPLELVLYDDKSEVPACIANLNKLIQQDKVFATIGPFAQYMQGPAREVAEQYKVPMVGPGPVTAEDLASGKKYEWSVLCSAGGTAQAPAIVKAINHLGWKNILALGDTLQIDQETLRLIGEAAGANGYKFTLMPDTVELTTQDFQPILNKMLQQIDTLKPDAIICYMNPLGFPAVAKGLRGLGVTLPILAGSSCAHPAVFSMGPEAVEGVYVPDPGGNVNPMGLPDDWPAKELQLKFAEVYQAKYNSPPDFFAADGSDLVTVLVAGMKAAGELDQAKVMQALNNLTDLPTLQGLMTFTPENNSHGAARGYMVLWQIKNAQFTFVRDLL